MAVNNIDIYKSKIEADLNDGLTWYKKDDLGYGSIQEKYGYKDVQIATIRKHPILKDLETTITVFNIIDDTKDGSTATSAPVSVTEQIHDRPVASISGAKPSSAGKAERVLPVSDFPIEEKLSGDNGTEFSEAESASAFANL